MAENRGRLAKRLEWIDQIESRAASAMPFHPNILSGAKLLLIAPLLILALKQVGTLPGHPFPVILLFLCLGLLDYLYSIAAREKEIDSAFGRIFDRVTDFPVLLAVTVFCFGALPAVVLTIKFLLDITLVIQHVARPRETENRIHSGINYATLLAMLMVSQGWESRLITSELVVYLMLANIAFSVIVVLYNLKWIQKRFIADALSAGNLLCGVFSMIFAAKGRIDISLLFLMLGAAFDGFDGAAARKYGGTRWGVYSDDVADGVNYGIAPGVALILALGGIGGWVVGIFYSLFTISRLVYFTLNRAYSDPNYFCGVPSTVGALVALCSLILFPNWPVIIGMMIGIACIQMVSFDTNYRHLGRALSANRRVIYGIPVMIVILMIGNFFLGKIVPVAIIFIASLVYGFLPTFTHFGKFLRKDRSPSTDGPGPNHL